MKLLVEVPEIEPALKDGSVNLSTLATIQGFVQRKNSQRKAEPVSRKEKKDLVLALQGKSRRECERELARRDPSAVLPKEMERVVGATQTEIRFVADDALMEKLKRIRELDAHVIPGASYLELFHRMADLALKKLDPVSHSSSGQSSSKQRSSTLRSLDQDSLGQGRHQEAGFKKCDPKRSPPPAEPISSNNARTELVQNDLDQDGSDKREKTLNGPSNPRFIPAALKRAVWRRDRSQCAFVSSAGRRCSAKFGLQIDHRLPVALGGTANFENLRLLCRAHNQYEARMKLGPSHYC